MGPLPPPGMLRQFDEVVPGLAERIVSMAERNQTDRLKMNGANRWLAIAGQIFAFTLAMTAVVGSIYLAMHDKPAAAVASVLAGLGVPLAVLVVKRQKQP